MSCPERDTALLQLATGEARLGKAVATQIHMLSCEGCRTRYAGFVRATALFAPKTGWARQLTLQVSRTAFLPRVLIGSAAAATLLFLLLVLFSGIGHTPQSSGDTRTERSTELPSAAVPGTQRSADGCLPGLPSDRCR